MRVYPTSVGIRRNGSAISPLNTWGKNLKRSRRPDDIGSEERLCVYTRANNGPKELYIKIKKKKKNEKSRYLSRLILFSRDRGIKKKKILSKLQVERSLVTEIIIFFFSTFVSFFVKRIYPEF